MFANRGETPHMASGERPVDADRTQLIASGKDADVFVRSDGLLVKRSRTGTALEPEAELLRYLSRWHVPVPRVVAATGSELVMDYVTGPTMAAELSARPWRAAGLGRCLARLHRRLDGVPAPPWLRRAGHGDRLVHLDLHPGNVLLGPDGPVVVDWVSAARGDRGVDVALSWLVLAAARLRPVHRAVRWTLLRAFLAGFDRAAVRAALPEAAAHRLACRERDPAERASVQRLVERMGQRRVG
jgi:aminoglycoside phosphotransferase (APT) family kinase protein